ncbi:MAG TPA: glycine cleavage T C-terminal barrel domain-containing protein [Vicinamibacterales bacterium]
MSGYDAARTSAVVADRSGEARLRVTGADRATWLQGLLTNDVLALAPGQGCYAAYLTPQGRMISDMRVLALADAMWLDVPAVARETVLERFETFIITEDVQVEDVTAATARLALHGPAAGRVLAQALSGTAGVEAVADLDEHQHVRLESGGTWLLVAGARDLGVRGYDLYMEAGRLDEVQARLVKAGAQEIDAAVWDTLRIEAGRPVFGIDMDMDTIPLEAGIEGRAISQTKGCYVGQEIVIRILHRGGGRVAKRLVGLVVDPSAVQPPVPQAGTTLRQETREIGRVTSATWSPALERIVALGYVHRDAASEGTIVTIEGEPALQARVTAVPFVQGARG